MDIPDNLFQIYKDTTDDFINSNFGVNCTIYYPPIKVPCPECEASTIGNKAGNVYQHGQPAPYQLRGCVYCGGEGYREHSESEVIKLRVYNIRPQEMMKLGTTSIPEGLIQVYGFIYDLPKFLRADYLVINSDQSNYRNYKFVRYNEPMPHGFKKDRYFMCLMERS